MRRWQRPLHGSRLSAVSIALALTACVATRHADPLSPLAGTWRYTHDPVTLELTLTVSGAEVEGSGTIRIRPVRWIPIQVDVLGQFAPPDVELDLLEHGLDPDHFSGQLEGDSLIRGVLRNSQEVVVLRRVRRH